MVVVKKLKSVGQAFKLVVVNQLIVNCRVEIGFDTNQLSVYPNLYLFYLMNTNRIQILVRCKDLYLFLFQMDIGASQI